MNRKSITPSLDPQRRLLLSLLPMATMMKQQLLLQKNASACASKLEFGGNNVNNKLP
jgi:hypothetical protein